MNSYVLSWAGSGATSELYADSDELAINRAIDLLGNDPVVADQWDADGSNDDGEPCKRILFWESEQDAENDPGVRSIAQLSTIGEA